MEVVLVSIRTCKTCGATFDAIVGKDGMNCQKCKRKMQQPVQSFNNKTERLKNNDKNTSHKRV